ncbi:conserved Plasmodium protein, unknown function [Plasmodium ovale]|uniref:Uncharacterized protein n=1 Tax=Plasmodium ovale TaxID=36330 RepID=A0A1C3KXE4_PLAOA|nr:conserved Plasmodium protein, unknown function [Plasmodium ovale]
MNPISYDVNVNLKETVKKGKNKEFFCTFKVYSNKLTSWKHNIYTIMNENHKDNENGPQKRNKLPRESLLDEQFEDSYTNRLLFYNDKDPGEISKMPGKHNLKTEKPHIHRNLICNASVEKYKNFLAKLEKSNQDIENKDANSVIIDKDILDQSYDNINEACVVMDVSMGIFDVCNDNISESKLRERNITISNVGNYGPDEPCGKELIEEI